MGREGRMRKRIDPRNRAKAVLQGLLLTLGKRVYRTKLVKLTYLTDEANFRFRGETLTGLSYMWDNYGPNAEGNEIVVILDELVRDGLVGMTPQPLPLGSMSYFYEATDRSDPSILPLSSDDWIEIHTAVQNYGDMNTRQIVQASKSTSPMKDASQYDRLNLRRDHSLTITDEDIASDLFLQEAVSAALSDKRG